MIGHAFIGKKYDLEYRKEILLVEYKYELDSERKENLKRVIECIEEALILLDTNKALKMKGHYDKKRI